MDNGIRVEALRLAVQGAHAGVRAVEIAKEYESYLTGALAIEAPAPQVAAVTVKASIKQDYLICLDDGRRFKSLKRHLATLGMTPDQYRAKWKLPAAYPMVAPSYAAQRSELAKKMGLGKIAR